MNRLSSSFINTKSYTSTMPTLKKPKSEGTLDRYLGYIVYIRHGKDSGKTIQ